MTRCHTFLASEADAMVPATFTDSGATTTISSCHQEDTPCPMYERVFLKKKINN
jgi:hypothetical protein